MTTRRNALLALPLACPAVSGLAQAPKVGPKKRLGVIADSADSQVPPAERPLYVALKQKGWGLGENLIRVTAFSDGKTERLAALAEELVSQRVDLILAIGDTPAVFAARATRTVPIIFRNVVFPVEIGLVDSLARPGRNATGQSAFQSVEVARKPAGLLKEIAPNAKRLAYLVPGPIQAIPTVPGGRFDYTALVDAAANDMGFELRIQRLQSPQDLHAAFAEMLAWRVQAVIATPGGYHQAVPQQVAELLIRHRLPSAFLTRDMVDAGALLFYGVGRSEAAYADARLADYIDRVLRGAAPATLPVEQPRRYELVINMKTAKALGLAVPQAVLIQADELIE